MNSKTTIAIAVIAVLVIGGYLIFSRNAQAPATPPASNTQQTVGGLPSDSPLLNQYTVTIDKNGFTPKTLSVKVGSTVTFKNTDTAKHWPASDPHPIHNLCPGFDAKRGLATGESYSFTFTTVKTCTYHDHLNPSSKGTIDVTQ